MTLGLHPSFSGVRISPSTIIDMAEIIFIVVVEDRHIDVEVTPFASLRAANSYLDEIVSDYCRDENDIEEVELTHNMKQAGWVRSVRYSCEGDSVRIDEKVLGS